MSEPRRLGRLYEEQRREAINEDYKTIPREVLQREFKAVEVMNETVKPPSKLEQKTAFTLDLYINNITDELNGDLESAKTALSELQKNDDTEIILGIGDLISDWNKLVVYLKSYEKSNNIGVRDKEAIWERLTDEVLPNIAQLIEVCDEIIDNYDYPIITNSERDKLLDLETHIQNKQFILIKGVSIKAKQEAETREREARRLGEKDAREIESFIRRGGLESKTEVLKKAFSDAEIDEIERKLDEIRGLSDENQRKNLREELQEQLIRRLTRGFKGQFFGENLRQFKDKIATLDERQLIRTRDYLEDQRAEAEDIGDADAVARNIEKLRAVGDQLLIRQGYDMADLYEEGGFEDFPEEEELDEELYIPPTPGSRSTASSSSSSSSSSSTPSSSSSSSSSGPAVTAIDITARPPARRGRPRIRGGARKPLLNRVFEGDDSKTLGRYQKNRVHLPFDDMNDDPYFILKKMNIH